METRNEIVDFKTELHRLGGYVTKREKRQRMYGAIFLLFLGAYALATIHLKVVETSIKSVQLHNLVVYHDINGFRPVHK